MRLIVTVNPKAMTTTMNKEYDFIQKQYLKAIEAVKARQEEVNTQLDTIAVGKRHNLHVAAHMDVSKTIESLGSVLEYKKLIAGKLLNCSNENEAEQWAQALRYSEELVKTLLGMTF